MRVWIVKIGEPWPLLCDGRPRRAALHASYLTQQGHDVHLWTGTFEHRSKIEHAGRSDVWTAPAGFKVHGLYAGGYRRNISPARISYHRRVASVFASMAERADVPDVIVAALTPLEVSEAAVQYGRAHNVPVVVDVRDLWPDVWRDVLPAPLRPLAWPLLRPHYRRQRRILRGAAAVTGTAQGMVDWGVARAGRAATSLDRPFFLAYPDAPFSEGDLAAATAQWRADGIGPEAFVACFLGIYSPRQDFRAVLEGIAELPAALRDRARFVFCGHGKMGALIDSYAARFPCIVNAGWVEGARLRALLQIADVGLLPYLPRVDFSRSLPNKVFEYASAGLPIVTSLHGEIDRLFVQHPFGVSYRGGDAGSFRDAIEALMNDAARVAGLSAEAARAAQTAMPANVCDAFEKFLLQVKALI